VRQLSKHIANKIPEIFLILSAIGFTDALFLTKQHYSRDPFACPIFGGCEQVTNSIYSEIFGVPISLLGMIYYGTIFLLTLYSYFSNNKKLLLLPAQLTWAGMGMSVVLVYIMIYLLGAICFYCALSAMISTLLFASGLIYLKSHKAYKLKFVATYFSKFSQYQLLLGILRIVLGLIFLWGFIDKVGIWFSGGHPAAGFLTNGTSGIFSSYFSSIAYSYLTNSLYMFGLFSVGVALTFGFASRLATIGGVTMMTLIYLGNLPPTHHPFLDEHIVYILVLILLHNTKAFSYIGLGKA